MTAHHEHTPSTSQVLFNYVLMGGSRAGFVRWLAAHDARIEAAAKAEAYKEAQQIVAGDMAIDEQRGRRGADKVDAAYLIRELDQEIQELQEDDHA